MVSYPINNEAIYFQTQVWTGHIWETWSDHAGLIEARAVYENLVDRDVYCRIVRVTTLDQYKFFPPRY